MDAVNRRTMVGKRKFQRSETMQKGEKRRLIQLIVSLFLFLIVFLGRDTFPAQVTSWNETLSRNTDFAVLFAEFGDDIAGDKPVWPAFDRLVASALHAETREPMEMSSAQPTISDTQIVLLSETSRCGLQYVRANSFLENLRIEASAKETDEPKKTKPEVVTVSAQTYSPDGEVLPKKVSFQFYELGLAKTVSPVMGTITSEFGFRNGPISGKREFHLAIDIAAAKGTEIQAFADGTVRYIGKNDSFGLYLMIDHDNGVSTFYAHCSKLLVRKGDPVTCGQTVALVGDTGNATGPHLHFTLLKDDIRLDPIYYVDPTG